MAHHKSAKKRIVLSKIQNLRNNAYKAAYKTAVKRVTQADSKEVAEAELKKATSLIDKLVGKKVLHLNKAAHKKSQLAQFVNTVE